MITVQREMQAFIEELEAVNEELQSANGWIMKPFDVASLFALLETSLAFSGGEHEVRRLGRG